MTLKLAYPRLSNSYTLVRLQQMREAAQKDPSELAALSENAHPRAEPVPTGATVASAAHLDHVREHVRHELKGWLTGAPVPRDTTVQFDLALGRSLHHSLNILPADAAHEGTWSFLSSVLLPDIVWARFPDLHQDRVLGKRHRNTLRRAWFRYDVIGDLQEAATHPLGEDEMTGVFERSQVARDRDLVRAVTRLILDSDTKNRSEHVRALMKEITALTGIFMLDGLGPDDLRARIASLTGTEEPERRTDAGAAPTEAASGLSAVQHEDRGSPTEHVTGGDRADLVRRFHSEILILCRKVEKASGRRPTALLSMIGQMGGVEAARAVVGSTHPSDTFVLLWELGRLDLTLEQLVLEETFQGLFSDDLRGQARARLEELSRPVGTT